MMNSIYNTGSVYGPVSKFLHWVISVLVILMLALSYFLSDLPKVMQAPAFNTHKLVGLTILSLMVLRAAWTLINTKPGLPGTQLWERWAEHIVHWSFYIALFAMPIAGWVGTSASGRPPHYGHLKFVLPISPNKDLADLAFSIHDTLAIVIIVLVCIHVLAALYHHFFKKDDVLRRMWP